MCVIVLGVSVQNLDSTLNRILCTCIYKKFGLLYSGTEHVCICMHLEVGIIFENTYLTSRSSLKQCRSRPDCSIGDSMIRTYAVCSSDKHFKNKIQYLKFWIRTVK